jgi:hypothetical protein
MKASFLLDLAVVNALHDRTMASFSLNSRREVDTISMTLLRPTANE